FNPLAWLAASRLRLERELAADEAVLRAGMRPSSYAEDLLAIAGSPPAGALVIAIGDKPLPRRIAAIVSARRPRTLGAMGASALVFSTAAIALVVACASSAEQSSAPSAVVSRTDSQLQSFVENELTRTVAEWKATGGTILVMTPKGEVLAEAGAADRTYV